jgi:hypothetical protein
MIAHSVTAAPTGGLVSTTGWAELVPAPPAEIIAGPDGRRHLIAYRIIRMPGGITAMAKEIGEELDEGYRVEFTIDHDGDQAALPDRLRAAVHSAIGYLYLQPDEWHGWAWWRTRWRDGWLSTSLEMGRRES